MSSNLRVNVLNGFNYFYSFFLAREKVIKESEKL